MVFNHPPPPGSRKHVVYCINNIYFFFFEISRVLLCADIPKTSRPGTKNQKKKTPYPRRGQFFYYLFIVSEFPRDDCLRVFPIVRRPVFRSSQNRRVWCWPERTADDLIVDVKRMENNRIPSIIEMSHRMKTRQTRTDFPIFFFALSHFTMRPSPFFRISKIVYSIIFIRVNTCSRPRRSYL